MNSYALKTLLKVRHHKKTCAERDFKEAVNQHNFEEEKLGEIKHSLAEKKVARIRMADNFFHKAQQLSCSQGDVVSLIFSSKKNMCDEMALKERLALQANVVSKAKSKMSEASKRAIDANRNFKVVDKHYEIWQRNERMAEELKVEYENDDQNGVRFCQKKRA